MTINALHTGLGLSVTLQQTPTLFCMNSTSHVYTCLSVSCFTPKITLRMWIKRIQSACAAQSLSPQSRTRHPVHVSTPPLSPLEYIERCQQQRRGCRKFSHTALLLHVPQWPSGVATTCPCARLLSLTRPCLMTHAVFKSFIAFHSLFHSAVFHQLVWKRRACLKEIGP